MKTLLPLITLATALLLWNGWPEASSLSASTPPPELDSALQSNGPSSSAAQTSGLVDEEVSATDRAPSREPVRRAVRLAAIERGSLQTVEGVSARVDEQELETTSRGELILPLDSQGTLLVEAPGYTQRRLQLEEFAEQDEAVPLLLAPSGDVTLDAVDELGRPQVGEHFLLLPGALQGEEWDASWPAWLSRPDNGPELVDLSQLASLPPLAAPGGRLLDGALAGIESFEAVTDERGRASWRSVPAASGYRVVHLGTGQVSLTPAHERVPFSWQNGSLVEHEAPPRGTTGSLEVRHGQEAHVQVIVHSSSSVRGVIPNARPAQGSTVVVKLYQRQLFSGAEGRSALSCEMESYTRCSGDGSFRFEGVRPGPKLVRVFWREPGQHMHFISHTFSLQQAEHIDLGALHEPPGVVQSGVVELVDEFGRSLHPAEHFADGPPMIVMGVNSRPPLNSSPLAGITEHVDLTLGQPFHIHGLLPGTRELLLEARLGVAGPALIDRDARISPPTPLYRPRPSSDLARLEFVLERPVQLSLHALFPAGTPSVRCDAWLVPLAGGQPLQAELRADGTRAGARILVPSGEYRVHIHSDAAVQPEGSASFWAEADVSLLHAEQRELALELRPGASLDAALVDAANRPLVGQRLHFGDPDLDPAGELVRTHSATSDALGRLRLRGLVPGRTYEVLGTDTRFSAGTTTDAHQIQSLR